MKRAPILCVAKCDGMLGNYETLGPESWAHSPLYIPRQYVRRRVGRTTCNWVVHESGAWGVETIRTSWPEIVTAKRIDHKFVSLMNVEDYLHGIGDLL